MDITILCWRLSIKGKARFTYSFSAMLYPFNGFCTHSGPTSGKSVMGDFGGYLYPQHPAMERRGAKSEDVSGGKARL